MAAVGGDAHPQPRGDGLEGADFIRQIGPYDRYAIEWGYRLIPDAATPEDEKPTLDAWILARVEDPRYRFGSANGIDPRSQTEDLGDDPVSASGYGLANLKRVVPELIAWTSTEGEDYADLEELYGERLRQRQAAGDFGDVNPMVAVMVAARWFFYFFTVEKCFGAPMHFGMEPQMAVDEFIRLLRFGLLPRDTAAGDESGQEA